MVKNQSKWPKSSKIAKPIKVGIALASPKFFDLKSNVEFQRYKPYIYGRVKYRPNNYSKKEVTNIYSVHQGDQTGNGPEVGSAWSQHHELNYIFDDILSKIKKKSTKISPYPILFIFYKFLLNIKIFPIISRPD